MVEIRVPWSTDIMSDVRDDVIDDVVEIRTSSSLRLDLIPDKVVEHVTLCVHV